MKRSIWIAIIIVLVVGSSGLLFAGSTVPTHEQFVLLVPANVNSDATAYSVSEYLGGAIVQKYPDGMYLMDVPLTWWYTRAEVLKKLRSNHAFDSVEVVRDIPMQQF